MFDMLFKHEGTSKHKYQLAQPLKLPIIQISKKNITIHMYFYSISFELWCLKYPGPNLAGFE